MICSLTHYLSRITLLQTNSSSLSPIKMNQQVKSTKKSKKTMRLRLAYVVYERVSNGIVVEGTDQENQQVVLLDPVVLHPQEDIPMMTRLRMTVEEEVTVPPHPQEDSVVPHVKSSVVDIPRQQHRSSSVLIRKNSHVKIIVVRPLLKIDVMVAQCC